MELCQSEHRANRSRCRICPEVFVEIVPKVELSMAELGFRSSGHFRMTGAIPNGEAFVTVFANPKEQQTAPLFTTVVGSGPVSKTAAVIGFTTEFSDGTRYTRPSAGLGSLAADCGGRTTQRQTHARSIRA